jgi:5-methylcytosine-specific restriction enzyme subunit McrC
MARTRLALQDGQSMAKGFSRPGRTGSDMEAIPQFLILTERQSTLCRLDGDDVDYLLAHHRPHLDVRPTREREMYQLRPRGYVGVLNTPHTRISIRPKIPLRNLCYLLDATAPPEANDDQSDVNPGECLINFLALRLARLMRERAAAGLHRGYVERREEGTFLQGQLDVAEQMRSSPARKDRLACRFDDLSPDTFLNQFPKSTAEWLLGMPGVTDAVRQQLRQAVSEFQGVSTTLVQGRYFGWWRLFRDAVPEYRPLLFLCRLLLENLNSNQRVGIMDYPAFLLNLESTFENFCTRQVIESLQGDRWKGPYWVIPQEDCVPHPIRRGHPKLHFRPDIIITPHNRHKSLLVLDVKWKASPFVRTDLNQILTYCAALGFPQGMLVYPGAHNKTWHYRFPNAGDKSVYIQQLRVTGDLAACRRATERWLGKVRRLCQSAHSA